MNMFGITAVQAGLMAGCFTVANLIAARQVVYFPINLAAKVLGLP